VKKDASREDIAYEMAVVNYSIAYALNRLAGDLVAAGLNPVPHGAVGIVLRQRDDHWTNFRANCVAHMQAVACLPDHDEVWMKLPPTPEE